MHSLGGSAYKHSHIEHKLLGSCVDRTASERREVLNRLVSQALGH